MTNLKLVTDDQQKPRPNTYSESILHILLDGEEVTAWDLAMRTGAWSIVGLIYGLRQKGWQIEQRIDPKTRRAVYFMRRKRQLKGRAYWPHYGIAL